MTLKETLERVKLLFAETVVDKIVPAKFAEAKLVDGTVVYTEGDLTEGAILYVKVEEGEDIFAPEGIHELEDGKTIVTVGANGEITKIETKEEEMMAKDYGKKKQKMEVEVEIDPELIPELVAVIEKISEEMKKMKTEFAEYKERFEKVADSPAANRVKSNFSREEKSNLLEARLDLLTQIKTGKLKK